MYLVAHASNTYSGTNVDTTNWTQLTLKDSSDSAISGNVLPYNVNKVVIQDTGGKFMELGIGASGAQVAVGKFGPSTQTELPILLCAGQKVWIRAIDATATTGILQASFYKGKNG